MLPRTIAVLLMLGGALSTFSALETQVSGSVECTPSDMMWPAKCMPAHQLHPHDLEGGDDPPYVACEASWIFWCAPAPGSRCGEFEGYGAAIPGGCMYWVQEYEQENCIEDFWRIVMAMEYLTSSCVSRDGWCQCLYIVGAQPTLPIEICDCKGGYGEPPYN